MARSLYICYFGLRQPLVQTQVLPYLRELRKDRHEITLLTFEPGLTTEWTGAQIFDMKAKLQEDGIDWTCLAYHKRFSAGATSYDIVRGALKVRELIKLKQIDILHGRVHVPTLMGALGRRFSRRKPKLLFDIRGFFPEEYIEAGIWTERGKTYRTVKQVEEWLMTEADAFVVLTNKARKVLFGSVQTERPVAVIPCCVDLEKRFSIDLGAERERIRSRLGLADRFVFVHAGALGGLYLTEQITDLLEVARRRDPSTFAMFLTQSDPELIRPLLQARGFGDTDHFIGQLRPEEVPAYLCAADAGISFVKAGYATQSRSPTKIPEYLACGIPLVANSGVGDVDELITGKGIGVLVDEFSPEGYGESLAALASLGDVSQKCRETARLEFDLVEIGGKKYRSLYERLADR